MCLLWQKPQVQKANAPYLKTDVDANVPLYERFGFKVTSQADFAGVNNRFMWREARPSFNCSKTAECAK
jgi:hypothetical protein